MKSILLSFSMSFPLTAFMFFTEWLVFYTYIREAYKKRNRFSTALSLLFFAALMVIYRYVDNVETLNIVLTLICYVLCIFCCFNSTLKSSVFHGAALCVASCLSEYITILFMPKLPLLPFAVFRKNEFILYIYVAICRLIYFSVCRLLLRISSKEKTLAKWGRWLLLLFLPVSNLFIIYVTHMLKKDLILTPKESALSTASLILLLFSNIIVFIINEWSEKSSRKLTELELSNQKNEINMQYLQLLEVKNEKMNIMAHDYKNHLIAISEMSESPEVKEYINKMYSDICKYNRIAKTKNRWLDVILSKYSDMCDTNGIDFETNVSTDNLDFINNYDISALFNNILDNAFEAARNSKEKKIYLEITRALGSYHKVIAKNSSDIPPKSQEDKLLSTKSNNDLHGFGTKSIQKIVKKYHGELQWEYDCQGMEFKLIILFPDNSVI